MRDNLKTLQEGYNFDFQTKAKLEQKIVEEYDYLRERTKVEAERAKQ